MPAAVQVWDAVLRWADLPWAAPLTIPRTLESMRLFRVIVPVLDIDQAATFYSALLGNRGERVTSGRHYFDCEGMLLACLDSLADGDSQASPPNTGHCYISTNEQLDAVRERAILAGAKPDPKRGDITVQPWGERSFYARDPWGNPFAIVEAGTEYVGGEFNWPG
ncbi:VOC family protein [Aldersonia sp. NBC_00410]|uniref:VOC family protein n=1 Tax=Aldersonia sp. NBC_00410 TaxID=2975954 RepID=UPI002254597E|nr:VOC family protein [Aldersonia sp. NBC_00410]MCX5045080.1 VOC family protein [Aldersonia sp. NBC_00410]